MKVLKKIRLRLGLPQFSGNLSSSNAVAGGTNNLPPLLFHPVHGENIRVSECGAVARRVESFCKGLTFSSRPVRIAEKVYVKIIGVSNNWSGVIRFGFTANDPSTLRNALPKYACPDMTNKPGCWAKALAERFAEVDSVLFYYVTQTGDVHFGINGEERGVFFTGVETRGPLWAVLDVYGNSTAIQLLDPRQQLNNSRRIQTPCSTSSGVSACQQGPSPSSSTSSSSSSSSSNIGMVDTVSDVDRIIPSIASLSLQQQQHLQVHLQQQQNLQRAAMAEGFSSSAVTPTATSGDSVEQVPVQLSRFQPSGSHYSPLPFHRTRGRNVRLSNDRCVASRLDTEFSRGYVFTSRPIVLGEKIVVQVLATDAVYVGALAFGLTSCNPSQIPAGGADLPDDSDLLLDRPEYWVVSKDVAGGRPERGDEISVCVTHLGEVLISKNGSPPEVRMHVDHTLELWAFFDVYGTTQKIRIIGSFIEPQPPTTSSSPVPHIPASTSGMSSCVASSSPATSWPSSRPGDQQPQAPNLSRLRVCLPSSSDHPAPPPYHPAPSVVLTPVASVSGTTSPSPAHPNHHPHHHSSSHHHHSSSSHQSSPASSASPTPGSGVLVVNLPPAQSNYLNQQQQQSQSSQQPHGHGSQQSHQGSQQSGHHQNHRMPHMSSSSSLSVVAIPPSGSGTLLSTYSHTYIEPVSATTSYSTLESSGGRTGTMMSGAGGSGGTGSECSICYERPIDSVLYMCGHMCMCYECALQQWRGKGGGHCPLCRALIKDVIRTYKS